MSTRYAAQLEDVRAASERISGLAHRTPVVTCETLDRLAGRRLFFKCEHLQKAGAFKFRGASNMLARLDREKASRGKAFVYRAELQPNGPARRLLQGLRDRLFGGDAVALVASLMDSRPPSADELAELEQLVKDLKQRGRGGKRSRRSSG